MRQTRIYEFDPLCKKIISEQTLLTSEYLRKMRWWALRRRRKRALFENSAEFMKLKKYLKDDSLSQAALT